MDKTIQIYKNNRLSMNQDSDLQAQIDALSEKINTRKAFALACRCLADYLDCPLTNRGAEFPERIKETDECGASEHWRCWQKYLIEITENEAVCRICGCTFYNACEGGCYWIEPDLCSKCSGNKFVSDNHEFKNGDDCSFCDGQIIDIESDAELYHGEEDKGIYMGYELNNEMVHINPFNTNIHKNANYTVLGTPGSGMSFRVDIPLFGNEKKNI